MTEMTYRGSLPVPEAILFRYCPKDWGHWKPEGERCPVCRSKIAVARFIPASEGLSVRGESA